MLAKKFLLQFLTPVLVLLVGAEVLFYEMAASRLQKQVDRNLLKTTDAIDDQISARIEKVRNDLRVISADPAFTQYFQYAHLDRSLEAGETLVLLQEHFLSIATLDPSYLAIRFYDPHGTALASIVDGQQSWKASDEWGSEWFQRARALGESALVSEIQVTPKGGLCLRFASPLRSNGDLGGVLCADVELAPLIGDLITGRKVYQQGEAYLVEPRGTILLHRDSERVGRDVSDLYSTQRALAGYKGLTSLADESQGARMRMAFRPLTDIDLALVVAVPEAEIFAPIAQIRWTTVPVTLGGFLVIVLVGLVMLRNVVAPIRHIQAVAEEVGRGNLDALSQVTTGDEIEQLSRGFNQMTQSLRVSRESIQTKNAALSLAAEALRHSEQNLRITLNSIGDAVIATDCDGRITRINPVAATLTGFDLEQAVGRPLAEVFHIVNRDSRKKVEDPVSRVIRTGKIVGLGNHTVLISRDGTEHQIADSGAPIRDGDGEILGVVLVFRDVTQRYRMEEQLRQAQKMESIGRLAGGVAHDFNNLLAVIQGNAELLLEDLRGRPRAEDQVGMVDSVLSASRRGADLTSQLLSFSRDRPMDPEVLDLHAVVDEVLAMAARTFGKRVEIRSELQAPDALVLGEKSLLENAILNLAINARDAMPEGGMLTISTREVDLDEADCERHPFDVLPGRYVLLAVSDTGMGMDPATRERIFEPFFSTKSQGTGLGMFAVYGTVASHGGAIDVTSKPMGGTRVDIYFPIASETKTGASETDATPQRGEGRILVVDDEPQVLRSTATILERLGYEVVTAENGHEALTSFVARPSEFDLVLLDMILPRESGRDVLKRLIVVRRDVRVLLMSGYSQGEELEEALEMGAKGLLRKPFGTVELSRAVSQAIQESQPTSRRP